MIDALLTAKVAPRRVKYRVRHFGRVFVFGRPHSVPQLVPPAYPKISIPILVALPKRRSSTAKNIDLGYFCTFGGKNIVACGGQGERDADARRAVRALTRRFWGIRRVVLWGPNGSDGALRRDFATVNG